MKRPIITIRGLFGAWAILALLMALPLHLLNSVHSRWWIYPGANIGIDPDHYVIVRCGSGAQNLFWLPIGPLLAFSICVPVVVVAGKDRQTLETGISFEANARTPSAEYLHFMRL